MLKMSDTSRAFLSENFPQLLEIDDLDTFLDELDTLIIIHGFDSEDEITDFGREAESVYDEVYYYND